METPKQGFGGDQAGLRLPRHQLAFTGFVVAKQPPSEAGRKMLSPFVWAARDNFVAGIQNLNAARPVDVSLATPKRKHRESRLGVEL